MADAATYLLLKQAHVGLVLASVGLFAARGLGVLAGAGWPMARGVRHASVGIDTLLLGAGVALWMLMNHHPLRDAWLGAKLVLLPAYIVLGSVALKRGRTKAKRTLAFAAALGCVATMAATARAKALVPFWAAFTG